MDTAYQAARAMQGGTRKLGRDLYRGAQEPFHFKDDASLRTIPSTIDSRRLRVSHFGYPTGDAERDPNCVFPIDRLRELVADGTVGELAPSAITSMGGIYSHRRVVAEVAPRVLDILRAEAVDLFFFVPA